MSQWPPPPPLKKKRARRRTGVAYCRFARAISPKMAACRRVQLLLLLMSVSFCICTIQAFKTQNNGIGNGLGNQQNAPGLNGAAVPVKDVPVAAASQPRRTAGWKLAEEEACREDLTRLCPKNTWTNNLAVLECFQERKEVRMLEFGRGRSPCFHVLK